jgi:hypothetical protein
MRHLTVRSLILALAVTVLPWSIAAFGQFGGGRPQGQGGGYANGMTGGDCLLSGVRAGGNGSRDTSEPRPGIDKSGFVYARVKFNHLRYGGPELPWHHDYPDADAMLPEALQRLTGVHTTRESFQIVDIDSEEIFKYPFVYMSEPGFLDLQPDDLENLREYLDRGGFLFVDDFRGRPDIPRGMEEFENFVVQLKRLYPDRELRPVDHTHKIFHTFFDTDPRTMLPPYTRGNSGDVAFFALSDEKERIQVMVHFNNDAGEYWQTLDVGTCKISESGLAVQLGINYVIYAMTH